MPPEVSIRDELPADAAEIGEVVAAAFSSSPFGHHGEARLVERLRGTCPEMLSLVASLADRLAGHVLFSPVVIEAAESSHGMGLAPVSVSPAFQRRGIGTLLIRRGIEILRERACSFVCVLGDPAYYARFGFEPAARFGLDSEFGGASDGTLQILWLRDDVTKQHAGGMLRYRPEFSSFDHTSPLPPGEVG